MLSCRTPFAVKCSNWSPSRAYLLLYSSLVLSFSASLQVMAGQSLRECLCFESRQAYPENSSEEGLIMTSKYHELSELSENARRELIAHQNRCRQYMATLVSEMLKYCEIPLNTV